jgi:NAD-dependent dihydropyrimidine dehydrogenase PreA subunit
MTKQLTVVISRDRTDHSAEQRIQRGLLVGLAGRPELEVALLPHLYDLLPDGPGARFLQAVEGDMLVLGWLYPRAIFWILDANRVQGHMGQTSFFPDEELPSAPEGRKRHADAMPERTIWCIDLRGHEEAGPLLAEIERIHSEVAGVPVGTGGGEAASDGHTQVEEITRPRWYPVVDYGRCGNCLECLNFCLFGVFGLDESGMLLVEEPDACRDGCPACARVCPSGAIMFPQHNSPAIAGHTQASAEAFQIDLGQLPGSGTGISAAELAAAERQRALAEKTRADHSQRDQPTADKPPAKDDLDALVDELDKTDL